jgi:23S rRNA (guanosine2251-2'-O)-methyltransferase
LKTPKKARSGKSRSHDEWIYGLNPVLEALQARRQVKSVFIASTRRDKTGALEQASSLNGVTVKRVDPAFFDQQFPKGHQGVAALVAPRRFLTTEDIMRIPSRRAEIPLFLILDCPEDPRNFGAILRSAEAGGVHGVVIQSYRSVTLSPEASKTSAGAAEHIAIARASNIKHAMRDMKSEGLTIIGAESGARKRIWDLDLREPLALVVGSEGRGLRRTVKEQCDVIASLPVKGRVNSLNISVAVGILIFEAVRQREYKQSL